MATSETKKKTEDAKETPSAAAPKKAPAVSSSLAATVPSASLSNPTPPVPTPTLSSLASMGLAANSMFGNPMLPMWPGAGLGFPAGLAPVLHPTQSGASSGLKPPTTKITRPKRYWLKEEDDLLLSTVELYGVGAWARVAEQIPNRSGKQCRERYYNHLRPNIDKSPWTREEDAKMLKLNQLYGHKWTLISGFFSRRTQGSVKNRFYSLKRRHEREARRKASAVKQTSKPFLPPRSLFVGTPGTPPNLSTLLPISTKDPTDKASKDKAQADKSKSTDEKKEDKPASDATPEGEGDGAAKKPKKRKLDDKDSTGDADDAATSPTPAKKSKKDGDKSDTKKGGENSASSSTTATTSTAAAATATTTTTSTAATSTTTSSTTTTAKSTPALPKKPIANMLPAQQLARSANMAMPLYFPPFLNTANLAQNKLLAGLSLAQQSQRQNLLQRGMLGMKTPPVRPPPGVQLPMSYFTPAVLGDRMAFLQYMQQLQQLQQLQAWSTAIAGGAIKPPLPNAKAATKPAGATGAAAATTTTTAVSTSTTTSTTATSTTATSTAASTTATAAATTATSSKSSMPGLTVLSTNKNGGKKKSKSNAAAESASADETTATTKDNSETDSGKDGKDKEDDSKVEESKEGSKDEDGSEPTGYRKTAVNRWLNKRRQNKKTDEPPADAGASDGDNDEASSTKQQK